MKQFNYEPWGRTVVWDNVARSPADSKVVFKAFTLETFDPLVG